MIRFFVATGPDGRQVGWQTRNRDQAEQRAIRRFGVKVPVTELSVVQWRQWREGPR